MDIFSNPYFDGMIIVIYVYVFISIYSYRYIVKRNPFSADISKTNPYSAVFLVFCGIVLL